MNIRMTIAYDGTRYKGWQRLGAGEDTIQGKVEECLSRYFGEKVEIIGASRTDSGVHALGQVANFQMPAGIDHDNYEPDAMKSDLNAHLPEDIRVMDLEKVSDRFHARFHCTTKIYHYSVSLDEVMNPLIRKEVVHGGNLDIQGMKAAAKCLVGTHDYTAYTNAKGKKKSMVRTINDITFKIEERGLYSKSRILTVAFEADGFLHNMIRRIMGMLLQVGEGHMSPDEIKKILDAKDRSQVTHVAPPNGLCLMTVNFGKLT